MADNKQNLADAISGWQSVTDAIGGIGDKLRSGIADILAIPDNPQARREIQNSFSSYAKGAGDLSTSLDSPGFESAVANKYSGFQAGQTNLMTAAANEIARADVANERANRKIDNLNQQKEINNKIVNDSKNFMKAISAPPVIGTILGLFDSDYSISDQMQNLAYDSSQLENLKTQDQLDDELILQKAFGKVGYNPLANDVIEPANRWEKQYYDELTSLQRNKISAMSNKIAAKGGELDAYKAETDRARVLASLLADESKTQRKIYGTAAEATKQDKDIEIRKIEEAGRTDRTNTNYQKSINQGLVDLAKADAEYDKAMIDYTNSYNDAVKSMYRADSDKEVSAKNLAISENNVQNKQIDYLMTKARIADNAAERASREKTTLMQLEGHYVDQDTALIKQRTKLIGKQTKDSGKSTDGSKPALKPLQTNTVTELASTGTATADSSDKLQKKAAVAAAMNNGQLLNDQAFMADGSSLDENTKVIRAYGKNATDAALFMDANPEQAANYRAAIKNSQTAAKAIEDKIKGVRDSYSKEGQLAYDRRLANGGYLLDQDKPVATNFLATNKDFSIGDSVETKLYNSFIMPTLSDKIIASYEGLSTKYKAQLANGKDFNELNETEKSNAIGAAIVNLASGANKSTSTKDKLILDSMNLQRIFNDVVKSPIKDSNGKYLLNPDGTPVTLESKYEDYLTSRLDTYLAESVADEFNKTDATSNNIISTNFGTDNMDYNGEPIDMLGKRIVLAGYSPDVAKQWVAKTRNSQRILKFFSDYRANSISYDLPAASVMPELGYDNIANRLYGAYTGQAINQQEQQDVDNAFSYYYSNIDAIAQNKARAAARLVNLFNQKGGK